MLLPLILGSSPHPPVSVYGTGAYNLDSGFSRQRGLISFGTCISLPIAPSHYTADFPTVQALRLDQHFQRLALIILLRPHVS